ncbi:recombinase family protein [Intestinibacillus massiliensis]|nr:recombinase family protein [Intestinibacillus massiliensis]
MTAVYARQSADRPDSISVETQVQRCLDRLPASERAACRTYTDRGFSGKDTGRPAFQALLSAIRDGEVGKLLVYKLDRVSRSVHDFTGLCALLREKGVAFQSCEDGLTLDETPAGTAMAQIMMVFAQFERETIQRRVTDNYYSRARAGMYLGGRPPFGFGKGETRVAGKKTACYIEAPAQAEAVRALYRRYLEPGASLGSLMRWLNDGVRIPTGRGGAWGTVQLGRLLRNPAYVRADAAVYRYLRDKGAVLTDPVDEYTGQRGCYLYAPRAGRTQSKFTGLSGAYVTLAPHAGLVDAQGWLCAQRKLDQNRMVKNSGRGSHSWLSGLMKCAACGYAVTVSPRPSGGYYLYCGGRKKGKAVCPGRGRTVTLGQAEAAVAGALLPYLQSLADVPLPRQPAHTADWNRLEAAAAGIEEEIARLGRNMAFVEQEDVVRTLAGELHARQQALGRLRAEQAALPAPAADGGARFQAALRGWPQATLEEKKLLARAALECVRIGDGFVEAILASPYGAAQ